MKKFFIGMVVFAIVGVVFLVATLDTDKKTDTTLEENLEENVPTQAPTFNWAFEEASTLNPDGSPQTNVYLSVNGEQKRIDTVDGSCSENEGETYESDVSNTGKVQCYYAGLGQRYRIVKIEDSYAVERKLFEEALPDVALPEREWEVVTILE